jgi:predicted transposase YdaD
MGNTPEARMRYEFELKAIRDYHAGMEYAVQQGELRGELRGEQQGELRGRMKGTIEACQSFGISENQIIERLISAYDLSYDEAREQLKHTE